MLTEISRMAIHIDMAREPDMGVVVGRGGITYYQNGKVLRRVPR